MFVENSKLKNVWFVVELRNRNGLFKFVLFLDSVIIVSSWEDGKFCIFSVVMVEGKENKVGDKVNMI